jgi:hypothetical protein
VLIVVIYYKLILTNVFVSRILISFEVDFRDMPTFMLDRLMKPRECEGANTADEEKEEVVEKDNDNVS